MDRDPQIPDLLKAISIVTVSTQGTYQIWTPIGKHLTEETQASGWHHLFAEGVWPVVPQPHQTELHSVYVRHRRGNYPHIFSYAAGITARICGFDLCRLDRQPDGFFRCPWCNSESDRRAAFAEHLETHAEIPDTFRVRSGPSDFVRDDPDFRSRNLGSRLKWLRVFGAAARRQAGPAT